MGRKSPITVRQQENVRGNITRQATTYVNMLDAYIKGEPFGNSGDALELSPNKLKAIGMLLDKSIPSVQSVEHVDSDPLSELSEDELQEMLLQSVVAALENPSIMDEARRRIAEQNSVEPAKDALTHESHTGDTAKRKGDKAGEASDS